MEIFKVYIPIYRKTQKVKKDFIEIKKQHKNEDRK